MATLSRLNLIKAPKFWILSRTQSTASLFSKPGICLQSRHGHERIFSPSVFFLKRQFISDQHAVSERKHEISQIKYMEQCVHIYKYVPWRMISDFISNLPKEDVGEKSASQLLWLLGNRTATANNDQKNMKARSVFDSSNRKTANLFNSLLQCYVENGKIVNSDAVLEEMKERNVEPNKFTYVKLIAILCMDKDLGRATEMFRILKSMGSAVPMETYGYLSYALCMTGQPTAGIAIVDSLIDKKLNVSWHVVSWLCRGLAESSEIQLLQDFVDKYVAIDYDKLLLLQMLDIYKSLAMSGNEVVICKFLDCMDISLCDIKVATYHLENHESAGYLLDELYKRCRQTSIDVSNAKFVKGGSTVLSSIIKKHKELTIDELWDKVLMLNEFHSGGKLFYMALYKLLQQDSPLSMSYILKLVENKLDVKSHMILPMVIKKNKAERSELFTLFEEHNVPFNTALIDLLPLSPLSITKEQIRLQQLVSNAVTHADADALSKGLAESHAIYLPKLFEHTLKTFLESSSNFDAKSFAAVLVNFSSGTTSMERDFDSHIISEECISLIRGRYLLGNVHKFKKLFSELQRQKFPMTADAEKEISDILLWLEHVNHRKEDVAVIVYKNAKTLLKSLKRNNLEYINEQIARSLVNQNQMQYVLNALTDARYHFPEDSFNILLSELKIQLNEFPPSIANILFCHFLETGNVREAEKLLESHSGKININFEKIPASMLAVDKPAMRKFLMKYITDKEGHDRAVWIMYTSLLKANLIEDAAKFFCDHPNVPISSFQFETLLSDLTDQGVLSDAYNHLIEHCEHRNGFSSNSVYLATVKHMLTMGRVEDATRVVDKITDIDLKTNFQIHNIFASKQMPPPVSVTSKYYQQAAEILQGEAPAMAIIEKLEQLPTFGNFSELIKIYPLLCMFYSNISIDEYEPVNDKLKILLPGFKPEFQSQILLNRIQQLLSHSRFDEALAFVKDNLALVNDKNFSVCQAAIDALGTAALQHQKEFILAELFKLHSINVNYELKLRLSSYKLYYNLKYGGKSTFPEITLFHMHGLVQLLMDTEDYVHFDKAFESVLQQGHNSPNMKYFVAAAIANNCEMEKVRDLLQKADLNQKDKFKLLKFSYALTKNFENLEKIDSFFYEELQFSMTWNRYLNNELFATFDLLCGTGHVQEDTLDYMIKMYHAVPSFMNTPEAQNTYYDVITKFRYSDL